VAQKLAIEISQAEISDFCRRWHIRKLSLFGSILRHQLRPDSDVDVLVEFQPGRRVGLIQMARIERELSSLLRRKADLRTPADLSRYFRNEVLREAQIQYAEG
jgi:predicted nucleotidyltransferase